MSDDYLKVNPVLRKVMKEIYRQRKPLPISIITEVRIEKVNDKAFCEVWFMTKGCVHDAAGGCTMCNYGKGHEVDRRDVLRELQKKFDELPVDLQELIVTPTGSMLDDCEVPEDFRSQIFSLLKDIKCYDFFVETRLDTITEKKLAHLRSNINSVRYNIEVGIECCDDWILRNIVNKNVQMSDLKNKTQMVHQAGMHICANIGMGLPFVSERYSIILAVQSIRKALDVGCDNVVLFPYHVKPGTLLAWLLNNNLYRCCSLWSIPKILSFFSPEDLKKIHISWYRNYYKDKSKVLSSPTVCEDDKEKVLSLLDEYKNHPGEAALKPLLDYSCLDKEMWLREIERQNDYINLNDFKKLYFKMAEAFYIPEAEMKAEWEYMMKTYGG